MQYYLRCLPLGGAGPMYGTTTCADSDSQYCCYHDLCRISAYRP